MINLLLRLVEPSSGTLKIGGYNLQNMGLCGEPLNVVGHPCAHSSVAALRSAITVIPQQPLLMAGTVRKCIDPFNQFTDEQVSGALKKVRAPIVRVFDTTVMLSSGWACS